jgi:hypothetical protein
VSEVPEALEPLAFLLGRWRGRGEGCWPTVGRFEYEEEMSFEPGGAGEDFPFFTYRERAWNPEEGTVLHSEQGFWTLEGGVVAVTLAHPIGVTEIGEGSVNGGEIRLASSRIAQASTGLPVTGLLRTYRADDGELTYEISMSTDDVPMTRHLAATLRLDRERPLRSTRIS